MSKHCELGKTDLGTDNGVPLQDHHEGLGPELCNRWACDMVRYSGPLDLFRKPFILWERKPGPKSLSSLPNIIVVQLGGQYSFYYIKVIQFHPIKIAPGISLAVQWLRLCAPNAGGTGLIPGWGTKIPHAALCDQNNNNK